MIKLEKTPQHSTSWSHLDLSLCGMENMIKPERGPSSVPSELLYDKDNVMSKPERRLSCEIHFMLAPKLTRTWKP